jgi:hypothetical protein
MVIVGECGFPLVLVASRPLRRAMLAGGLLFHAAVALLMNLNTFFWSFAAAYPALEGYCHSRETAQQKTTRSLALRPQEERPS